MTMFEDVAGLATLSGEVATPLLADDFPALDAGARLEQIKRMVDELEIDISTDDDEEIARDLLHLVHETLELAWSLSYPFDKLWQLYVSRLRAIAAGEDVLPLNVAGILGEAANDELFMSRVLPNPNDVEYF